MTSQSYTSGALAYHLFGLGEDEIIIVEGTGV
jgi:hypothetical protein